MSLHQIILTGMVGGYRFFWEDNRLCWRSSDIEPFQWTQNIGHISFFYCIVNYCLCVQSEKIACSVRLSMFAVLFPGYLCTLPDRYLYLTLNLIVGERASWEILGTIFLNHSLTITKLNNKYLLSSQNKSNKARYKYVSSSTKNLLTSKLLVRSPKSTIIA